MTGVGDVTGDVAGVGDVTGDMAGVGDVMRADAAPRAQAAPAADAPSPLFSARWLRRAADLTAAEPLDEGSAVRLGLCLTDAPAETAERVLVQADLSTGQLRFSSGDWGERPALVLTLSVADAAVFLFGDGVRRVRLFERDGVRLEGVFLFVFFLDRMLQQDRAGVLARLRAVTANLPPAGDPAPHGRRPRPAPGRATTVEREYEEEHEEEARRRAEEILPGTLAVLRAELGRSTPGAQLAVVHRASGTRLSVALGDCRPGVPFTRAALPIWYCCSKSVGAVAVGQLWERGLLDPLAPVSAYLPWFTGDGRESVTLYQLLTHTSAVPMGLDPLHGTMAAPLALRRERLRTMTVPPDARPGTRIAYAPWWAWFLIAEVVRTLDGRDYERYLAEEVLAPCGMDATRVVLSPPEYRELADRLPLIHLAGGGAPIQPTHWYATEASCTRPIPGLNIRGPMSDLALFFEALMDGGQGQAGRVLRPQTVMALTARHRVGLVDAFGNADWGLGFRNESHHLGEICTAFSRHASLRAFGHYGLWTSSAFADPDAGLVVALHLNGKTWQEEHQTRMIAIGDALYRDLGLT
ncbi:serine hydrolase domain-containing protein [Streptomyces sp. MNP-20]|uniref:serine hydrolase domain-containing protein n=1 Tax=Streptomyces sp. MNP-20 TaxID=2721165 RepID=UPI0028161B1E|nr:serine hydrolase domain-containing protein [Streptomyces sp. MNP-20]